MPASSRRPESHPERKKVILTVGAHLSGPTPDAAVREAFEKHLSAVQGAYDAALGTYWPLDGRWKETRQSATERSEAVGVALRNAAAGVRNAKGRAQTGLTYTLLGGNRATDVAAGSRTRQVTLVEGFLHGVEGRGDLLVHPAALATLKEEHAALVAAVTAETHAWGAWRDASRKLADATAAFDRGYARFVRAVQDNASPAVVQSVIVWFTRPERKKGSKVEGAARSKDDVTKAGKEQPKKGTEATAEVKGKSESRPLPEPAATVPPVVTPADVKPEGTKDAVGEVAKAGQPLAPTPPSPEAKPAIESASAPTPDAPRSSAA